MPIYVVYLDPSCQCIFTIVKLGSCSSLLKSLNSTLKVSIQKQKEQSWCNNHSVPTHPPPTHNFLTDRKMVITIFQLKNNTEDIFYPPFPNFKIPKGELKIAPH